MAVPKRRQTRGRRNKRRSHKNLIGIETKVHGMNHRLKRYYDRMRGQGGSESA